VLETAPRPTIRTIVASFVFTDLVGFSKGSAADQYAAKARLSSALRRNLSALRESDYWIKDTGDGALIAFVSNPEHALYMALALAHEYPAGAESGPSSSLRTGLHLGTVKESIDVEARRNFIGDGINAAKRIMDFAQPGQIAASRSFFEAIGNLDAAYAALFQHLGAPDDKHGRAHELYALAASDAVLDRLRADLAADGDSAAGAGAVTDTLSAAKPAAAAAAPGDKRRTLILASVAATALVIAALFVAMRGREPSPPTAIPTEPPSQSTGSAASSSPANMSPKRDEPAAAAAPKAEVPLPESPNATPKSAHEPSAPAVAPGGEPVRSTASAAPARAKAVPEVKPKISAPASGSTETRSGTGPSSPRCTRILEKAALGEPLAPDEKRELANTCR
jgi:hypothetical protein